MSDAKETNIQKLKDKLRELFQLDRGDLDFGLYRVMAIKSEEVNKFLDEQLLPQVEEALGEIANADQGYLKQEIDDLSEKALRLGIQPDENERIQELKRQLSDDKRLEAKTYNHLLTFFSRYYDEGDFMALHRNKGTGKEAYAIPYNGEEVKLHWANADQYYIKTTENYASYIFIPDDGQKKRVQFEMQAADNEKDVVKETNGNGRFFLLAKGADAIVAKKNQLTIRFDHRPLTPAEKSKYSQQKKQDAINEETHQRILKKLTDEWRALLSKPASAQDDEQYTLLGKHLNAYTAKNSFDYFIHKDLGGFLRRELYAYLKSEVIHIDNLEITDDPVVFKRNLAQLKAVKSVGNKIIDFLAQLEDFQKQLYLKKKFVLDTHYCVTLDKVPQSLYADIIKNKAQCKEWVDLFAIDELKGDIVTTAYSKPLKPEFLKENPHLVLDTRHFDEKFTDKLLAALSDESPIDEQMNGLLVHGDNFQALNLMQERYKEQVQCVYIDPPYNTGRDGFLFKDALPHSSWISMMESRYVATRPLLTPNSVIFTSVGNEEIGNLDFLLQGVFGSHNKIATAIRQMKKGANRGTYFAPTFDYVSAYAINKELVPEFHTPLTPAYIASFNKNDNDGRGAYKLTKLYEPSLDYFENCRYPILCPDGTRVITPPSKSFSHNKESFERMLANNEIVIQEGKSSLLITDRGDQTKWSVSRKIYLADISAKGKRPVDLISEDSISKDLLPEDLIPEDVILDKINSLGTKALTSLGLQSSFSKPVELISFLVSILNTSSDTCVLDYFAGSGVTGHAVINLNRKDKGGRKYILAEIGHHFEDVLLPRIKKVAYSTNWKDGKPKDQSNRDGVSQVFRYICLESYEDTLDSLVVDSKTDLVAQMQEKQFMEDYQLRYALGTETTESASLLGKDFIDPFNYTLSVVRDGIRRDVRVDLAETFNFLLGLRLSTRRKIDGVLAITGTMPKGENCLILWRNIAKMNNAKLEKWFKKNRDTFGSNLNLIYVNGDHTLNAIRQSGDQWKAHTTEPIFKDLMFA